MSGFHDIFTRRLSDWTVTPVLHILQSKIACKWGAYLRRPRVTQNCVMCSHHTPHTTAQHTSCRDHSAISCSWSRCAQPSPAQYLVTFSPVTVLPAPARLSPPPPRPNHPAHQIQFNDFIKFRIYSQIHHPLHNLHNIYKISTKSYVSKNVGWPQLRINLHNISFLRNKYV